METKEFKGNTGNWEKGNWPHCIVSDQAPFKNGYNKEYYKSEFDFYGGYLVCDNIRIDADANLIAAAPELLETLAELVRVIKVRTPLANVFIHELIQAEKTINKALGNI